MSPPVLLFINTDTCRHCIPLIEERASINAAAKNVSPDIRCIWIILDNMNLEILPSHVRNIVNYVPIVMYFSGESWDYSMNTGVFSHADVYPVTTPGYGAFTTYNLNRWLRQIIHEDSASQALPQSEQLPSSSELHYSSSSPPQRQIGRAHV